MAEAARRGHKKNVEPGVGEASAAQALVLSVVNGLILVRVHLRDRARLVVSPVHPDTYQWWFRAPSGVYAGRVTRRFGFVVYAGIGNKGHRAATLSHWRLRLRSRNGKVSELRALSMPEPTFKLGEITKGISCSRPEEYAVVRWNAG